MDSRRSLNVNIFLRQFKNKDIIEIIKKGKNENFGAEKLKGLLKILPNDEEHEELESFTGDESKLADADKFLCQLIAVPK